MILGIIHGNITGSRAKTFYARFSLIKNIKNRIEYILSNPNYFVKRIKVRISFIIDIII